MKDFVFFVLCWLATAAWVGSAAEEAQAPDVFLVTIDTLRADRVHCYGYEQIQTPALAPNDDEPNM